MLHWCKRLRQHVFFLLSTEGLLVNKRDLRALYLSGTYCHMTGTRPPSCGTLQQPTIYVLLNSKFYFRFFYNCPFFAYLKGGFPLPFMSRAIFLNFLRIVLHLSLTHTVSFSFFLYSSLQLPFIYFSKSYVDEKGVKRIITKIFSK